MLRCLHSDTVAIEVYPGLAALMHTTPEACALNSGDSTAPKMKIQNGSEDPTCPPPLNLKP